MTNEAAGTTDKTFVDAKYIQEHLLVSRTKSYEIIAEIGKKSSEPDAVIKFGRSRRVRRDVFLNWALHHGKDGETVDYWMPDLGVAFAR